MFFFILGVVVGIVITFLTAPKIYNKLVRAAKDLNTAYDNMSISSGTSISRISGSGNVVATSSKGKSSIMVNGLHLQVDNLGRVFINGVRSVPESIVIEEVPETEKEKIIAERIKEAESSLDSLYSDKETLESEISEMQYEKEDLKEEIESAKYERAEFNSEFSYYIENITSEIEESLNNTIQNITHLKKDVETRLK